MHPNFQKMIFWKVTRGRRTLTFDLQDKVRDGCVANEALGGEAPEVGVVVELRCETHSASCDRDAATGTQAALL